MSTESQDASIVTVITNNQERTLLSFNELAEAERIMFAYCNGEGDFIRYRGETYHLDEFLSTSGVRSQVPGYWDGYSADSFFSGILVKFVDEDHVVMGRYFA